VLAEAIGGRPAGGAAPAPEASRPQTWDRLDTFSGTWRCTVWGLDAEGNRVTASGDWTGRLASTRAVRLNLDDFDVDNLEDNPELEGYCQMSYDPTTGYELLNVFSSTPEDQRWVGERMAGEERYNFYYVGSSDTGTLGTARRDTRIELRFIGQDVFLVDTYVQTGSGEVQVQSYRFTRSS
jgi:hypothetical protein